MELKDYLIISFIIILVVIFIIYYIRKYHHSKESYSSFPSGTIIIWVPPVGTAPTSAPAGWAVCDGTNGTPDLRGRFLLGANPMPGGISTSLLTVGTDNTPLPANIYGSTSGGKTTSFNLTVANLPPHNHLLLRKNAPDGYPIFPYSFGQGPGGGYAPDSWGSNAPTENWYTDNTGSGTTVSGVSIMPPFYTVIYIMKL
jgi:hypothetical protein